MRTTEGLKIIFTTSSKEKLISALKKMMGITSEKNIRPPKKNMDVLTIGHTVDAA